MTKEKIKVLNLLKNTYCRLKPSKISGVGVFAIKDIPKGVKLFSGQIDERWYKFKITELKKLDPETMAMIDDFFVIEKDGTVKIPKSALNGIDMSFYVNHSKKPNAKPIDNGFTFVAARDIKKGEEITANYGQYDYKYKK